MVDMFTLHLLPAD